MPTLGKEKKKITNQQSDFTLKGTIKRRTN